jgi:hypothetical protein
LAQALPRDTGADCDLNLQNQCKIEEVYGGTLGEKEATIVDLIVEEYLETI